VARGREEVENAVAAERGQPLTWAHEHAAASSRAALTKQHVSAAALHAGAFFLSGVRNERLGT